MEPLVIAALVGSGGTLAASLVAAWAAIRSKRNTDTTNGQTTGLMTEMIYDGQKELRNGLQAHVEDDVRHLP